MKAGPPETTHAEKINKINAQKTWTHTQRGAAPDANVASAVVNKLNKKREKTKLGNKQTNDSMQVEFHLVVKGYYCSLFKSVPLCGGHSSSSSSLGITDYFSSPVFKKFPYLKNEWEVQCEGLYENRQNFLRCEKLCFSLA